MQEVYVLTLSRSSEAVDQRFKSMCKIAPYLRRTMDSPNVRQSWRVIILAIRVLTIRAPAGTGDAVERS